LRRIRNVKWEASRPQAGASRERDNVLIVPFGPAHQARPKALAGHGSNAKSNPNVRFKIQWRLHLLGVNYEKL